MWVYVWWNKGIAQHSKVNKKLYQWKHASQYFEIWVSTHFLNKAGTAHQLKHSWGIRVQAKVSSTISATSLSAQNWPLRYKLALLLFPLTGDHLHNCPNPPWPFALFADTYLSKKSPKSALKSTIYPRANLKDSCHTASTANITHYIIHVATCCQFWRRNKLLYKTPWKFKFGTTMFIWNTS